MADTREDRFQEPDAGLSGGSLAYVYLLTSVAALGGLLLSLLLVRCVLPQDVRLLLRHRMAIVAGGVPLTVVVYSFVHVLLWDVAMSALAGGLA